MSLGGNSLRHRFMKRDRNGRYIFYTGVINSWGKEADDKSRVAPLSTRDYLPALYV